MVFTTISNGLHPRRHIHGAHLVGPGCETRKGLYRASLRAGLPTIEIRGLRHSVGEIHHAVQPNYLRQSGKGTVD